MSEANLCIYGERSRCLVVTADRTYTESAGACTCVLSIDPYSRARLLTTDEGKRVQRPPDTFKEGNTFEKDRSKPTLFGGSSSLVAVR